MGPPNAGKSSILNAILDCRSLHELYFPIIMYTLHYLISHELYIIYMFIPHMYLPYMFIEAL